MCDFYIQASIVIEKLLLKKGSIKGLAFNANSAGSKDADSKNKTCYALVCETLKYKEVIDEIITLIPDLGKEKKIKYSLLLVMIYELLFSTGQNIRGGGMFKKLVMSYQNQLVTTLARIKIKRKVANNIDLLPENIRNPIVLPRYVRINTLAIHNGFGTTRDEIITNIITQFTSRGFLFNQDNEYQSVLNFSSDQPLPSSSTGPLPFNQNNRVFYQDKDFKEILVFDSSIDLHDDELLKNGSIVLQDKASCLPSLILSPPENSVAIDSCSAPGNKTSLLSALMNNTGQVYAIEKDPKRMTTLVKLTTRSKCKNIEAINDSFFNMKWDDPKFKDVEYILCDPSCSGSGIVNRLDHLLSNQLGNNNENDDIEELINERELLQQQQSKGNNNNNNKKDNNNNKNQQKDNNKRKFNNRDGKHQQTNSKPQTQTEKEKEKEQEKELELKRLKLLADFQLSIIMHAFGFPKVKKVIYSTCSIHQTENEDVVKRALDELNKDKVTWRLVNILPHWKNSRGIAGLFENSDYTLRMFPERDNTIGFYVALFEKIDDNNNNNNEEKIGTTTTSTITTTPPSQTTPLANTTTTKTDSNNSNGALTKTQKKKLKKKQKLEK